ncbi:MAG: flagellar basal body P-ring formation chaperone FlgA [Candidatus Margulisiibacteriota bacterium]
MRQKIFKYFSLLALVVVVSIGLFFNFTLALSNPEQKAAEIIKDYIMAKYPNWSRDEIRITFKFAEKTFENLKTLGEDTTFKVLEVYPEFKPVGNVIFPIEIFSGNTSQKIFLRAKVEVIKKVAVAAKGIKKKKVLEATDLKLEERDIALLPQKYYVESERLVGKEAKINIPANSTIFEWMVGEVPLIRQGDEVMIVVSAPGLTVKAKGEALEDGYGGQEIKVKRKESKKILVGKVISPTEVEVKP